MKRTKANYYVNSKIKCKNHEFVVEEEPESYLYAKGIYKTKIKPEDLPEWFVKIYIRYHHEYCPTKGIKDMIYNPNYISNHLYKDDLLYVSYDKPITKYQEINFYKNYDLILYGPAIVKFIDAVKVTGEYNVDEIKKELEKKKEWFIEKIGRPRYKKIAR